MDQQSTFLQSEYVTLRDEIKEAKTRTYKTLIIGLTGVPAAHHFARTLQIDILLLALPVLVFVLGLMYLADNHTIMRCGRYIRCHIEPAINPSLVGWEMWLEREDGSDKRSVDRLLTYSFYVLSVAYFIISVFLAVKFAHRTYGAPAATLLALIYTAPGAFVARYIATRMLLSTTTSTD
jgi:hypothetical protein